MGGVVLIRSPYEHTMSALMIYERDKGGRGGLTAAHCLDRCGKEDDLKSVHTDHMLRSDPDVDSPPPDVPLQCIRLTCLLLFDLYYGMSVCQV